MVNSGRPGVIVPHPQFTIITVDRQIAIIYFNKLLYFYILFFILQTRGWDNVLSFYIPELISYHSGPGKEGWLHDNREDDHRASRQCGGGDVPEVRQGWRPVVGLHGKYIYLQTILEMLNQVIL